MRNIDFCSLSDDNRTILDMMFCNCDSEEELQEAIGDMMESFGED